MSKIYQISEDYLEELLNYSARSLVGKVCKRLDLFSDSNTEIIKKDVKELIYEQGRHLRDLLNAYQMGFQIEQFKVKNSENNKDTLTKNQQ